MGPDPEDIVPVHTHSLAEWSCLRVCMQVPDCMLSSIK